MPRARSEPGDPPLRSRLRPGRHARHLAHACAGTGEGRRRPRPLRAQVPRLRNVAGTARGGRVPRLAARDERGGAGRLRRTVATLPRDGLRVRGLRGRAAARRVRGACSRDAGVRPQGVRHGLDRRLAGDGSRGRATGVRQALRPAGVADPRDGRARLAARAQPRANRGRRPGGNTNPGAAGRAQARGFAVGEAAPCRRDPGSALRLLDDDRAGRQAAATRLARAPGSWSGAGREAGRPQRRTRLRSAKRREGARPLRRRSRLRRRGRSAHRLSPGALGGSPEARARSGAPARAAHPGHGSRPRLRPARRRWSSSSA